MTLGALRADELAERGEPLRCPAVRDHALELGQRRPDARDLGLCLPSAAEDT